MNIKQFFYPTKTKVIIWIILLTPAFIFWFSQVFPVGSLLLFPFLLFTMLFYFPIMKFYDRWSVSGALFQKHIGRGLLVPTVPVIVIFFIASAVYSYLISCIVVYAFTKIKKTRKGS